MKKILLIPFLLALLGSGCANLQTKDTWMGFYYLGTSTRAHYSKTFQNLSECQDWALDKLHTAQDSSPSDSFDCLPGCIAKSSGQFECDQNNGFHGTFVPRNANPTVNQPML